jgi:hypothetical protein
MDEDCFTKLETATIEMHIAFRPSTNVMAVYLINVYQKLRPV